MPFRFSCIYNPIPRIIPKQSETRPTYALIEALPPSTTLTGKAMTEPGRSIGAMGKNIGKKHWRDVPTM